MRTQYDPSTALTFLLAGIGLGSLLAIIFAPRDKSRPVSLGARNEGR
jgi:hypothetical protein